MKSKLSGCLIDFNPTLKLKLKDQIGTGSFSYVYSTNDPKYVVKMINASDPKSLLSYNSEKYAFQNITKHQNIIECPAFKDSVPFKEVNYCCLVLEYCAKGSIITMMVDKKIVFEENQILQIFLDVLLGLHQMHTLKNPIAHRDLKGENVLLGEDGHFKLTDFGSISVRRYARVTPENREIIQEDIDKNTTPTIRAPEQCDLYSELPITEKVDIWALGCLLYIMCFQKQPFETKLSTINCQYFMSATSKYSKPLLELFPLMFVIDPRKRPNTAFLLQHFDQNFYSVSKGPLFIPDKQQQQQQQQQPQVTTTSSRESVRPKSPKSKAKEEKYILSFGEFGKGNRPSVFKRQNSDVRVKPSFKDKWQKYIKSLTTKTEAWILAALEESEEGPDQKFVRYLIIKAWQKPHKIKKFYTLIHKKYSKSQENTIITLKTLIVLHDYLKKGPNDVYFQQGVSNVSYPKDMLTSINQTWKANYENNLTSTKDKVRDLYTTNIIAEYGSVVNKKIELIHKYSKTIEGNYSIRPFLSNPEKANNPLQITFIQDLLNYLQCLINLNRLILLQQNLWNIQCNLALSILDEEFCLISLLTHLIVTYKKSTNYTQSDIDQEASMNSLPAIEEKYLSSYEELRKLFEGAKRVEGLQLYHDIIPTLPRQTIQAIQSMPTFHNISGHYYAKDHLKTNKSVSGLKIPLSYGELVKNINLEKIIDIEEDLSEPRPQKQVSESEAALRTHDQNINTQNLPSRPGTRKNEFHDFKPDFDAFNKLQNFQNFETTEAPKTEGTDRPHANLFSGFVSFEPSIQKKQESDKQGSSPHTPFKSDLFAEEGKSSDKSPPRQEDEVLGLDSIVEEASLQGFHKSAAKSIKSPNPVNLFSPGSAGKPMTLDDAVTNTNVNAVFNELVQEEKPKIILEEEEENIQPPQQIARAGSKHPVDILFEESSPIKKIDILSNSSPENDEKVQSRGPPSTRNKRPSDRATFMARVQSQAFPSKEPIVIEGPDSPVSQNEEEEGNEGHEGHDNQYMDLSVEQLFDNSQPEIESPVHKQQEDEIIPEKRKIQPEAILSRNPNRRNSRPLGQSPNSQTEVAGNQGEQPATVIPFSPEEYQDFSEDEEEAKYGEITPLERNKPNNFRGIMPHNVKSTGLVVSHFRGDSGAEPEKSSAALSKDSFHDQDTHGYRKSHFEEAEREEQKYFDPTRLREDAENELMYGKMYDNDDYSNHKKGRSTTEVEKPDLYVQERVTKMNRVLSRAKTREQQFPELVEDEPDHGSSLLRTQEMTSKNLHKFIHTEVSKNTSDWIIDYQQLKFLNKIGSGGSAQVYKGLWRGTDVAIKKLSRNQLSDTRRKDFEREISALMKLRPHQNLVSLMGVSLHDNDVCIITEFCAGGTLFEWLHEKKNFLITWKQKVKMAMDIACGMNYLHTCNPAIMHRDLKSLNLLLDGPLEEGSTRFTVKLADFGLARAEDVNQDFKTDLMGTFHWMAPEIFDHKTYTVKADVYSFAVVLWEIITRETPYADLHTPMAIMRYVAMERKRPDLTKIPHNCPQELIDLMTRCWAHDPQTRPDFAEVLEKLKFLIM